MRRILALIAALVPLAGLPCQELPEEFEKPAALGDRAALTKLLEGEERLPFILRIGRTCLLQLLKDPANRTARDRLDLLKEITEKTQRSKVLDHMERLYLEGGVELANRIVDLNQELARAYQDTSRLDQGDLEAAKALYASNSDLAKRIEAAGEMYMAFQAHMFALSVARSEAYPDREHAKAAVEGCIRCLLAWDLGRGEAWDGLKENQKALADPGRREGPAHAEELNYMPDSKWISVQGAFKPWRYPDRGVSQLTAAHPILWLATTINGLLGKGLGEKSGIGEIHGMTPPVHLLRIKSTTYGLDADLDGQPDDTLRLGNKPTLAIFDRVVDSVKTQGALFFWIGGSNEKVGGLALDMSSETGPNAWARVYYRGATCLEVAIEGETLLFIDENATGTFGDTPAKYAPPRHAPYGLLICDSMILPGGKSPVPFSDFISVGGNYYKLKFSGMVAKYRQLDMAKTPTGKIRLDFQGPASLRPASVIVGEENVYTGAYFDLTSNPKGVVVPAGVYRLTGGLVLQGSGEKSRSVSIGTGTAKLLEVKPGEEVTLRMGAPFSFDFKPETSAGILKVPGMSVKVLGAGGEVYLDPWEAVPTPEVYARKGGKGNGKKVGAMAQVKNYDELLACLNDKRQEVEDYSYEDALLAPLDFRVKRPFDESFEVRLQLSGHQYFGRIVSEWK